MSLEDHIAMLEKTIDEEKEVQKELHNQLAEFLKRHRDIVATYKDIILSTTKSRDSLQAELEDRDQKLAKPFTMAMHKMFRRGHYKKVVALPEAPKEDPANEGDIKKN